MPGCASSRVGETPVCVDGDVVVNGAVITHDEIAREMQYHPASSADESMFLATQALVIRTLLEQRISARHSEQEAPASDEEAIARLIESSVSVQAPDHDTCQRYYDRNPLKFTTAPLVAVRHILLACQADDAVERVHEASDIIDQLAQDADAFARLAQQHSACPSRAQGGSLGQISSGQTVPEFERQLFRLPVGLCRAPIQSRYGVHVVFVDQRIEGQVLPLSAVEEKIAAELHERAWHTAVATYIAGLIEAATIVGFAPRQLEGV